MAELENILTGNDIVLVDGSCGHADELKRLSLFARHYILVDVKELEESLDECRKLAAIIGSKKAKTTPGVKDEVSAFLEKIAGSYNHLELRNNPGSFYSTAKKVLRDPAEALKQGFGNMREAEEKRDKVRDLYNKFVLNVVKCVALFGSKVITIDHPGYQGLVDQIKTLDRAIGIKKSTQQTIRINQEFSDHDADERMIAAAYWISMFSRKKVAVLTRDNDFFKLLRRTSKSLGARQFSPYNEVFRYRLHENPVRLYYKNGDFCEELSTAKIGYDSEFLIRGIGERSREIRMQIEQYWKSLNDSHKESPIKFEC